MVKVVLYVVFCMMLFATCTETPSSNKENSRTIDDSASTNTQQAASTRKMAEITWPNKERTKQLFHNVPLKRYVRVIEGKDALQYLDVTPVAF